MISLLQGYGMPGNLSDKKEKKTGIVSGFFFWYTTVNEEQFERGAVT
jgi:hypothetical protein